MEDNFTLDQLISSDKKLVIGRRNIVGKPQKRRGRKKRDKLEPSPWNFRKLFPR